MKSGDITSRENHQIHYLLDLPEEKHAELVENDLLYDFNLDDDYALNWFESNVSNTDPQDPNRRYAISVTMISDRTIPQDMILSDLKFSGHPGGRRWKLGGGATHQKLAGVIDEVDSVDDKNDLVYISLLGHGSTSGFKLSDGRISYPELDSLIDPLESKVLLINESCYSGASIPHLSDPDRIVITSVSSDELTNLQFRCGNSIARPGISVKEAFLSGGNRSIDSEDGPQISNPSLADKIYLYQRDAWNSSPGWESI